MFVRRQRCLHMLPNGKDAMTDIKVAIVTGAARGIGRGIAVKLAKDGFDVAVADLEGQRQEAEETIRQIEQEGRRAFFRPTDVSQRDQVFGLVDDTVNELGTLDAMINNAGICQIKPMLDVTQEELETIYRINLFGMVYGVQAAAKKMIELGKKTGHIVSASSIAGFEDSPSCRHTARRSSRCAGSRRPRRRSSPRTTSRSTGMLRALWTHRCGRSSTRR